MAALLGGIGGLLSWPRPVPDPYLVPCWITEFRSPLIPDNTAAEQDRLALQEQGFFRRAEMASERGDDQHLLLAELAALKQRSTSDNVVIYVCAYAVVGPKGQVFLLSRDVNPANPQDRLPLAEVLQYVRTCPARRKLLILDVAWPVADPRLGILGNDVAGRIPAHLQAVEDPDRLVLCSCSPGQFALVSEDLKRSVFGYYLDQALRGNADGYNSAGIRNGRVSVREMAALVAARVDRWALHNRASRQTPVLYGRAEDFDLVALPHGTRRPPLPLPGKDLYPAWLAAGWKLHGQWRNDASPQTNPRLIRQLEATMLCAERQWSHGGNAGRIANSLRVELDLLQRKFKKVCRETVRPQPRSLAMAAAAGHEPDDAVADAVVELLKTLEAKTAGLKPEKVQEVQAKLIGEFQEKIKDKQSLDLAIAIFGQATADTKPRPETIRLLDSLLRSRQPRPRYVETLFLGRLAELAGQIPPAAWPTETVRRGLAVVEQGEQADCRERSLPWVRDRLDDAARKRHDGEYLFWARGYAPSGEADELLQQAADDYQGILAQQDMVESAYDTLNQALAFLPAYVPYLEHDPRNQDGWLATVQATRELATALQAGPRVLESDSQPRPAPPSQHAQPPAKEHRKRLEEVLQKVSAVQNGLEDLYQPFTAHNLLRLTRQCKWKEASPSVRREVKAILATPFLQGKDRVALWYAGRDLSRRLHQETVSLDQTEDLLEQPTCFMEQYDPKPFQRKESCLGAQRTRWSIALLRLAALDEEHIRKLQTAWTAAVARAAGAGRDPVPRTGEDPAASLPSDSTALANAVRDAWIEQLPAQIKSSNDLTAEDRFSRVYPGFLPSLLLDNPSTNPSVQLHVKRARALWVWLAGNYRYKVRESVDPAFYTEALSEYLQLLGPLPEDYVAITGPSELPGLSLANPLAVCTFSWKLNASPREKQGVQVRVMEPDGNCLRVSPVLAQRVAGDETAAESGNPPAPDEPLRLRVELAVDAKPSDAIPPEGFLVQFRSGGRTFHRKVAVPALPMTDLVEILLSADAKEPASPLDSLRLRPVPARQPFYLYVKNSSAKARDIVVQLTAAGQVDCKLTVDAKQVAKVNFEGEAPKPDVNLPELQGPLQVRVLDTAGRTVLAEKQIQIGIAAPREYVAVTRIQFEPHTAVKNLLSATFQSLDLPDGPPCFIELELPPDRIPGLLGVKGGVFRGMLPPPDKQLTLSAKDLQLDKTADEEGAVYITVDGVHRALAFHTTFARQGTPTTPSEDMRPGLRLRAASLAVTGPNYKVRVETDLAPAGATLELALGQMQGGVFRENLARTLPQARQRRVGFTPHGPNGALLLEAAIEDWDVALDTTGIVGRRALLVRLLDVDGKEICSATQGVVLGDGPPRGVKLVNIAKEASHHVPLPVRATVAESAVGISKVLFFVGQPADGKPPPDTPAVEGRPLDADKTLWSAELPLDKKMTGPTNIGVQFVDAVGLSSFATASVKLTDAAAAGTLGSIRGTVIEGTRPQPNLEVVLVDEKGAAKAKANTKDDGTFVFQNVKPGEYVTSSDKPISLRKGAAEVTVETGKTASVTIQLYL